MNDRAPVASDCIDFLSLLAEPKRGEVLGGSRRIEYPGGTVAVMPRQPDYAVVIQEGLVRVYAEASTGRQATILYVHRGELLTSGFVRRPAINIHVQAVTDAWLISLDVDHLRGLARQDADVSFALLTYYASVVAHSTRIIAVRSLGDITDRLVFDSQYTKEVCNLMGLRQLGCSTGTIQDFGPDFGLTYVLDGMAAMGQK